MSQATSVKQNESKSNTNNKSKVSSAHPVADKIAETLEESVDTLSKKAAQAEEGLRNSAEKGSESLDQHRAQLASTWEESSINKYVTENPVKAAGIAFAAGALIASILRGK